MNNLYVPMFIIEPLCGGFSATQRRTPPTKKPKENKRVVERNDTTFTVTFGKVDGGGFRANYPWQKTLGFKVLGGLVMNLLRFATKICTPRKDR